MPLPDARPLVVDEAYFEYSGETALPLLDDGRDRAAHVLEAVRARRRAHRLRARRARRRRRAERTPGAGADLDALGGARARRARRRRPIAAPVLEERERLASALRALGLAPLESHTNFLYVPVDDGARARRRAAAPGHRRARVSRRRSASRCSTRTTTTCSSRRSRACSTARRRSPPAGGRRVRTLRATAETRLAVRLALDGASRVRVATGAGLYDHFLEQLAFHAGFDLVLEGAGDLETGDHHTAEDAALALGAGARRGARRPARASRATATRSCRWTTRSRARRSTSAAARTPS